MSIPQPYDTGLTEEQLAEAFRRALGDMTDEEIENAIATAINLIPKGLVYRGAYKYFSELPSNAELGEVYTVKYKGTSGTEPDGNEYAWGEYEGTLQWIPLGVDAYTKNEIDALHEEIQQDVDANKSDISLLNENKMPLSIGTASSNLNEQKWYKLATFRTTVSNNTFNSAFYIQDRKNGETGILHICVERLLSNGVPSATASRINAHWISAEYQSYSIYKKRNNFVIVGYIENNYLVCELWCRVYDTYGVYYALQLTNTRQSENKMGTNEGWILEKTTTAYDKPYDTYPELTSPTVRVVYTKDRLAEALEKIDNFETRITALETALSQTQTE